MKNETLEVLDLSRSKQIIIKVYKNADLELFIKIENNLNLHETKYNSFHHIKLELIVT